MELNKIYNEDCIETMKRIPDASIDLMLTDPPYGTTEIEWDKPIDISKCNCCIIDEHHPIVPLGGRDSYGADLDKAFRFQRPLPGHVGSDGLQA